MLDPCWNDELSETGKEKLRAFRKKGIETNHFFNGLISLTNPHWGSYNDFI
jgi:hypothetical protein